MDKLIILIFMLTVGHSRAYVPSIVSTAPEEWDAQFRWSHESGLLGNRNVPESQVTSRASITEYTLKGGTNFGDFIGLENFSIHISGSYLRHGAEDILGRVTYGEDDGFIGGLELTADFFHEAEKAVGFLLRFTEPFKLNTEKFGKARIDTLGAGITSGFRISDLLQQEHLVYYGSGYLKFGARHQNATLVYSGLLGARFPRLALSGVVLKAGPFFESDLTERTDSTSELVGFRGYRLGVSFLGNIALTPTIGLDTGYVQKLSGAYFRATKDIFSSLTFVF